MYVQTYVCIYIRIRMYVYIIYVCTYLRMHIYIHIRMYVYTHIHTQPPLNTHTYTHTTHPPHTHIRTHTTHAAQNQMLANGKKGWKSQLVSRIYMNKVKNEGGFIECPAEDCGWFVEAGPALFGAVSTLEIVCAKCNLRFCRYMYDTCMYVNIYIYIYVCI